MCTKLNLVYMYMYIIRIFMIAAADHKQPSSKAYKLNPKVLLVLVRLTGQPAQHGLLLA